MLIAIVLPMPIAKKLIEEVEAFADRNPAHEASVAALLRAIRRIDTEFGGEVREALLIEARMTFRQQIKTLEASEQTVDALKTLEKNQQKLVTALKQIVVKRPEGVTLH